MSVITSKAVIKKLAEQVLRGQNTDDASAFAAEAQKLILKKKVRFTLLEHAATLFYEGIATQSQIDVTDAIIALHEIGGNVMAGMMLQLRLQKHFSESIEKATNYIIDGNAWYVCDIIGERVMGYALLTMPVKTMPALKRMAGHEDKWIVRCIGVAAHYAIKKGLAEKHVEEVFRLLLSLGNTTEFHTKKGIGWAAKTTAKFYPGIIDKYRAQIDDALTVKQWFRTKVRIGTGRVEKYAHRYRS